MKLKLIEKRPETPDVTSFIFSPEVPLDWKPGQFLRYTLPHDNPDDRGVNRFFSIASAPFEKNVRVTTRFTPEKGSSFKNTLKKLEVGAEIEATGPNGSFTVEDPSKEMVFIAGGIGITPYRAILLDLDHRAEPINITLLYANRNQEIVFKSEFDNLASKHPSFKIHYIIDPQRIDSETIKSLIPDLLGKLFYISGPEPMVEGVSKTLQELGVDKANLKHDYFPGYTKI